jgi:hypothetical protein
MLRFYVFIKNNLIIDVMIKKFLSSQNQAILSSLEWTDRSDVPHHSTTVAHLHPCSNTKKLNVFKVLRKVYQL